MNADGDDNLPGTHDDDLRLSPDSPCIQSGDPTVQLQNEQLDADLHARVLCGRLDMGAFEFGIGDYDCDRDIDLSDFSAWEPCFLGPVGLHYPPLCESNDFEFDNDIDLIDFAEWQRAFAP